MERIVFLIAICFVTRTGIKSMKSKAYANIYKIFLYLLTFYIQIKKDVQS